MSEREDDIGRIGASMAKMRLIIGRRYIGRVAVSRLGAGMELSHLDVLGLVKRIGRQQEVTVGTIAEQMRIDHSRASRIVAELVRRGVVIRTVSQADARRTIVALSEEGKAVLSRVEDIKHDVLTQALSDWPQDDIAAFATLYDRFMRRMDQQANDFELEDNAVKADQASR